MNTPYVSLLPANFKFKEGKHYVIKYRRTQQRFVYEKEYELYRHETLTTRKSEPEVSGYVPPHDMEKFLEYYMTLGENSKIEELKLT